MTSSCRILVIDPEPARRGEAATILRFLGEHHETYPQLPKSALNEPTMALVAAGQAAADIDVLLAELQRRDPGLPVLLLGGEEVTDGASASPANLIGRLEWPLQHRRLIDEMHRARIYREQYAASRGRAQQEVKLFRSLVGISSGLQVVRHLMAQVADTDATVLVLGESGTGKEVVARGIHQNSRRRAGPFVPLNCGAVPAELLESELFGHEKGSFTGAVSARCGRFELARGGTLFLDEIGDMPLAMQVKLLRVLQERSFERVGGNQTLEADVRIVCATHKNLDEMIAQGSFREDLYYRINVFPIEMPPLRERSEDLPLLVNELVARLEREQRGSVSFTSSAIESLARHPWAGNVRELANLVERMAITYPGAVVGARDLPLKFRHVEEPEEDFAHVPAVPCTPAPVAALDSQSGLLPISGLDLKEYLQGLERSLIEQALDDCVGVVARAAERLQLRRTTLVEKMRKYDLLNRGDAAEA